MAARFLLLLLALSLPFWALAQVAEVELLPGLPLSALMAVTPAVAALFLAWRTDGAAAARDLLARSLDVRRLKSHTAWLLLIVAAAAAAFAPPLLQSDLAPASAAALWAPVVMLAVFFVAALAEELGWTGYLLEPLARRLGETGAGLLIGAIWAAWHVIPFLQADRAADWIAWQCAKTVAERVVMVRLYFGGGRSLFAVTLLHAAGNVAAFSLPLWGATYDPRPTALILAALALGLTLARRRTT